MATNRRKQSPAEELALTTQVSGKCPLCGNLLFRVKGSITQKAYQIAHIYPLNPTPGEIDVLRNETRMHEDVNHPDNLIPLCHLCHDRFDKPRTVEEYRDLCEKKKEFIRRDKQKEIQVAYHLEDDIQKVIAALYANTDLHENSDELQYDPKRLTDKFDGSMPLPTQQKVRHNVVDYYTFIKTRFLEIDRDNPNSSDLIYSQVRTFYLQQKMLGLTQPQVFSNIVQWFLAKTKPETIEAAEIVASFFIQNCEVFE
ncbi:MAG: hypothetical protein A4E65_03817 [Syntrophorhabdus sp. PtaU1.Bin153]|nr:MAG: hypothetical protein A4E65_03817 [Syntrophorhabdus sp. PtaU1.Bin153]